jgi:hypothetical protein
MRFMPKNVGGSPPGVAWTAALLALGWVRHDAPVNDTTMAITRTSAPRPPRPSR